MQEKLIPHIYRITRAQDKKVKAKAKKEKVSEGSIIRTAIDQLT